MKIIEGVKYILFMLLVVYLLATSPPLYASITQQVDTTARPAISLGIYSHYGFIIPHSEDIRQLSNSTPWGLSIDLSYHFSDSLSWQYLQAYPRLGTSLTYYNFDNAAVLGNGYALILYIEPFLTTQRKLNISFRLGTGLAYLDRVYDPETNPENLFYSTKISFPLVANIMANYRLSKDLQLRAGGTYKHISNGGIRQPNKGINFPSASLGLDYTLRPTSFAPRELTAISTSSKPRHYLVGIMFTLKDRKDDPTDKLPVIGGTFYASQKIGRLSAITAGAEWIADFTLKEALKDSGRKKGFQRGALLGGHELYIGRFRFSQQLGIYVYAPAAARDPVYQRYGLEYHTAKRLFWGINLKAHRHVADFLDIRAGIKFPKTER